MGRQCIDCPKCKAECAFLRKYGSPGDISKNYDPSDNNRLMIAYECSLCGLCGAVCPVGLKPEDMFLEMRREAVDRKVAPFPEHKGIMAYERRGNSRRYSCYMIPETCDTVFFPGCTFSGTRPDQTMAIYHHLKSSDPSLGIVLDCCCKPSHDLGREAFFTAMNNDLVSFLAGNGVTKIISTCPNCHQIFKSYGAPLKAITVYEALVQTGQPDAGKLSGNHLVTIHDSCVARSEQSTHVAIRKIVKEKGFSCVEMLHSGCKPLCCGEGGNVEAVVPEFADTWANRRCDEANGRLMVSYCAGCANKLHKKTPTSHLLDAILDPESIVSGKTRVSKPPWTYLNRLRIKRLLKKTISGSGIHIARGDVIAILHADSRLPGVEINRMMDLLNRHPYVIGGVVGCRFDSPDIRFRFIELANDFRVAFLKISFGDQVQFFRRKPVINPDLFPDIALMEDVEFSIRLHRLGKRTYLFGSSLVSTRRWEIEGLKNAGRVLKHVLKYLLRRMHATPDTVGLYRNYYHL